MPPSAGIWVQSHEHDEAVHEIAQLCRGNDWTLATWDIDRGLALNGNNAETAAVPAAADPLSAIKALPALATPDGTAILVLRNFHRFLGTAEIVQALDTAISKGKQDRTFIVILSPVVQIPIELERQFVVVEHDLPGRDQIEPIARSIATEPGDLPEGDDLGMVLDAAAGLTRMEAENAFSLVAGQARQGRPGDALGTQDGHAQEERAADAAPGRRDVRRPGWPRCPEGVHQEGAGGSRKGSGSGPRASCCWSPPGCGKVAFAKSLGNETGRPTLVLDVGSLMGSLVGQTEERTRQALRIVDAMAPAVLFIDEIEKALAGVQSSGQTDSGVSARMFGTMLVLARRTTRATSSWSPPQRRLASCRPEFSAGPSGGTGRSSSTCPASTRRTSSGGCTSRSSA